MSGFDVKFPKLLAQLHALDLDYDDSGIDFEPYQEFQSADDNAEWIQAWTGNSALDGAEYRVFGQDGTGGYAAFWMVRKNKPVLEQPVVFFGSEGELGVVARDFNDYLWLLAAGVGPFEAVAYGPDEGEPVEALRQFAASNAAAAEKSPAAVLGAARSEFPDFEKKIRALCK